MTDQHSFVHFYTWIKETLNLNKQDPYAIKITAMAVLSCEWMEGGGGWVVGGGGGSGGLE